MGLFDGRVDDIHNSRAAELDRRPVRFRPSGKKQHRRPAVVTSETTNDATVVVVLGNDLADAPCWRVGPSSQVVRATATAQAATPTRAHQPTTRRTFAVP
jgi:hypothetical protein